jgi:hypothetical protein
MLKKFWDVLPLAIVIAGLTAILKIFCFDALSIGLPILKYTYSLPSVFFSDSYLSLDIFGWIFLVSILLLSLKQVIDNKKKVNTFKLKVLHGLTIGINCGFIAGTFLFHQSDIAIYFALILIAFITLVISLQDGLVAGLSALFSSSLTLFSLYLSLVLSALVGAIIALLVIGSGYRLFKLE